VTGRDSQLDNVRNSADSVCGICPEDKRLTHVGRALPTAGAASLIYLRGNFYMRESAPQFLKSTACQSDKVPAIFVIAD
jgi:hypothetical protein